MIHAIITVNIYIYIYGSNKNIRQHNNTNGGNLGNTNIYCNNNLLLRFCLNNNNNNK